MLEVLPTDRLDELARDLPSHIKPAMFKRNLLNAVMINPDLMRHPPGLIFREVSKAAALGLYLDPHLGEAYIIDAYNYKTKRPEPQLRVGYLGMIKLAKQSGEINQVYAHEVHANDFIEAEQGAVKSLVHKPKLFTDRGPIIGYYAVVKFTNGDFDYEPMDIAQIHGIRDRSDGWKAFKADKIKSTPWSTDEGEMSKKTVIRRLTKRMPKSPELASAIRIEDEAEFGELHRPAPRLVPPTPPIPPEPPMVEQKRVAPPMPPQSENNAPPTPPDPRAGKPIPLIENYKAAIAEAKDGDDLDAAFKAIIEPHMTSMDREMYEAVMALDDARRGELENAG